MLYPPGARVTVPSSRRSNIPIEHLLRLYNTKRPAVHHLDYDSNCGCQGLRLDNCFLSWCAYKQAFRLRIVHVIHTNVEIDLSSSDIPVRICLYLCHLCMRRGCAQTRCWNNQGAQSVQLCNTNAIQSRTLLPTHLM